MVKGIKWSSIFGYSLCAVIVVGVWYFSNYAAVATWDADPQAAAEQFARSFPPNIDKLELIQKSVGKHATTFVFSDTKGHQLLIIDMNKFMSGWQEGRYSRISDVDVFVHSENSGKTADVSTNVNAQIPLVTTH